MHKKSTKTDAVENSRVKISRQFDDVDEAVEPLSDAEISLYAKSKLYNKIEEENSSRNKKS
jgi:hypothetical protein